MLQKEIKSIGGKQRLKRLSYSTTDHQRKHRDQSASIGQTYSPMRIRFNLFLHASLAFQSFPDCVQSGRVRHQFPDSYLAAGWLYVKWAVLLFSAYELVGRFHAYYEGASRTGELCCRPPLDVFIWVNCALVVSYSLSYF